MSQQLFKDFFFYSGHFTEAHSTEVLWDALKKRQWSNCVSCLTPNASFCRFLCDFYCLNGLFWGLSEAVCCCHSVHHFYSLRLIRNSSNFLEMSTKVNSGDINIYYLSLCVCITVRISLNKTKWCDKGSTAQKEEKNQIMKNKLTFRSK